MSSVFPRSSSDNCEAVLRTCSELELPPEKGSSGKDGRKEEKSGTGIDGRLNAPATCALTSNAAAAAATAAAGAVSDGRRGLVAGCFEACADAGLWDAVRMKAGIWKRFGERKLRQISGSCELFSTDDKVVPPSEDNL